MKKKGFTLIELLAVIVILAIIALIAVPIVLGVIDKAKKGAFEDSVKIASNQIEMYLFKNDLGKIPANGINIKDLDIKSDFTSGKFVEEDGVLIAHFIKNKDYCAYGPINNLLIKKDCNDLDISYPVIDESKLTTTRTSNSITVIINEGFAKDEESGIVSYEINIYDGASKKDWETLNEIGNVTFNKLTNGKEYKIEVIVKNGNDMTSTATKEVETVTVDVPTYSLNPSSDEKEWASSRTVTINYPSGYTNEYSLDGGLTWTPYTSPIEFTESGSIIARVFDGENYITGSNQTVAQVDSDKPTSSTFTYTRTSKSITVVATGEDKTSSVKYAFSKDNGNTWTDKQTSNTYEFTGLTAGTYKIKVRVYDQANNYLDSTVQEIKLIGIGEVTQSLLDNNTTYGNYTYMNGTYLKGVQANNYVWYNGFLWRIMGINENGTVRLMTEENVTAISYGASEQGLLYATNEGYINDWLNEYFLSNLDSSKTDIITKSDWCLNTTTDSTSARQTCEGGTTFNASVGLITIDEYNLSGASSTNKTYYLVNSQWYWTLTPYSTSRAWHVNDIGNAYGCVVTLTYVVRPVIVVSTDTTISSGNGTLGSPYIIG